MVELKAIKVLEDVHLAQAINYLEAYNMEIGLLINFGNVKLQIKRVMKPLRKVMSPTVQSVLISSIYLINGIYHVSSGV